MDLPSGLMNHAATNTSPQLEELAGGAGFPLSTICGRPAMSSARRLKPLSNMAMFATQKVAWRSRNSKFVFIGHLIRPAQRLN